MEIGRLIFILNRSVIAMPGTTSNPTQSSVEVKTIGMEAVYPAEVFIMLHSLAINQVKLLENFLKAQGNEMNKK